MKSFNQFLNFCQNHVKDRYAFLVDGHIFCTQFCKKHWKTKTASFYGGSFIIVLLYITWRNIIFT